MYGRSIRFGRMRPSSMLKLSSSLPVVPLSSLTLSSSSSSTSSLSQSGHSRAVRWMASTPSPPDTTKISSSLSSSVSSSPSSPPSSTPPSIKNNPIRTTVETTKKPRYTKVAKPITTAPIPGIGPPPVAKALATPQGHINEFAPRIVVVGVGGAGGNAINNMISRGLNGVEFVTLNTDAQHLATNLAPSRLQIGATLTSGLGCGANPDAGRLAAEESRDEISELLGDAHMVFVAAGMGGGTGTGAAPVVAEICYDLGALTVGAVTRPFRFEGTHRAKLAEEGIVRLREVVDTLIVVPNQNLFQMAGKQTSMLDSFAMADDVLLGGVRSITDLMTSPGLINLDFADVQSVMHGMGNAILGTGQAGLEPDEDYQIGSAGSGGEYSSSDSEYERAVVAAKRALDNPLLGEGMDIGTAKGVLVNITGGSDMTLWEVDQAAHVVTDRIETQDANIIFGSAYDEALEGQIRVSVVATGIDDPTVMA